MKCNFRRCLFRPDLYVFARHPQAPCKYGVRKAEKKTRIKLIVLTDLTEKLNLKMKVEGNCAIITSRKNVEGEFDNFYNDNNEINAVMIVWCFAS